VNLKTVQTGLFGWLFLVNQIDVQREYNLLSEYEKYGDYYGAIAIAAIRSGRLNDLINGKR